MDRHIQLLWRAIVGKDDRATLEEATGVVLGDYYNGGYVDYGTMEAILLRSMMIKGYLNETDDK